MKVSHQIGIDGEASTAMNSTKSQWPPTSKTPLLAHSHPSNGKIPEMSTSSNTSSRAPPNRGLHTYGTHYFTSTQDDPMPYARLFERWPGRNIFLCEGRCMIGANPGCLMITILMIVVPAFLFQFYVLNYVRGNLYPIANGLLAISCLYTLLRAGLSDPGILPRTPAGRMTPAPLPGESREGDGLPVKYCQTCNFYRPPRAKHCKFCDNCVLEFDHHCPWTGSCVGRRNYSHFLTFLGTTFAYTVFMAVVSFRVILRPITILQSIPYPFTPTLLDSVKQTLSQRPMAAVLFCYAVVLLCSVVPLIIYHLELLANGITTNEEVRRRYNGPSPYNRGFCGNLHRVFLAPLPPPRLDLRVWVDRNGNPVAPASVLLPSRYVAALQEKRGAANSTRDDLSDDGDVGASVWLPPPPCHWTEIRDAHISEYSNSSSYYADRNHNGRASPRNVYYSSLDSTDTHADPRASAVHHHTIDQYTHHPAASINRSTGGGSKAGMSDDPVGSSSPDQRSLP